MGHLPLLVGKMVMLESLLTVGILLHSLLVILEGDTLSWICSGSEDVSLLLLIADSVAVMKSSICSCHGEIAKFRCSASRSLFGFMWDL